MSILFTTGATVTFKALVQYIAEPTFIQSLQKLGFSDITIQYGNETTNSAYVSKQFFSDVISANRLVEKLDLEIANEFNDKSVTYFQNSTIRLAVFAFSPDISSYIQNADVVVTHAGTGSILDALRLGKPVIAVTNPALMDDHQEEIAREFEKLGVLHRMSAADLGSGQLEKFLTAFKAGELNFAPLDEPPAGILDEIVAQEVGQIRRL